MTTFTGRIAAVSINPLGDNLVSDTAAGATSLTVDDAAEFNEDGGSLRVNDQVLLYASADDETGVLTLDPSQSLAADALAGDRVEVWDPEQGGVSAEWIAYVTQEGDLVDDSLEAVIDHSLIGYLPDGPRDGQGEAVVCEWRGSTLFVVTILGKDPVLNGSIIDPTSTIPPAALTDGLAPATSPAVTVETFAVGAVRASWAAIANHDPVTYDVYASLSTPVTTADALVTSIAGTSTIISALAGDQIPLDGSPVYVAVVARDADGAAPIGAEASASARQADNEYISALYGYLGTIEANQITTGTLSAAISISTDGVINVGTRITIADPASPDEKGGIVIWADDAHTVALVRLHPDGSFFAGEVEANEITVIESLQILTAIELQSSSVTTLHNGIADPTGIPALTQGPQFDGWPAVPVGFVERGICWDYTNGKWWRLLWNATTKARRAQSITVSTGTVVDDVTLGTPGPVYSSISGITVLGSNLYYCGYNGSAWTLVSVLQSNGAYVTNAGLGSAGVTTSHPAVGTDQTHIFALYNETGDLPTIAEYSTSAGLPYMGNWQRAGANPGAQYRFVGYENSNFGGYKFVIGYDKTVEVLTPSGTVITTSAALSFTLDQSVSAGGVAVKSSGTNQGFYSTHADGKLSRWSDYYPAKFECVWARYRDMISPNGTKPSPEASLALAPRRWVTASLPAAPQGVTSAELYVGYGGSSPGSSMYKRTETPTGRTWLLSNGKVTSGTAITLPGTNSLGGTPAVLQSEAGGFIVRGDGSGSWPLMDEVVDLQAAMADTGWVTIATVSPFTAQRSLAVRRIGNVVYLRGAISRTTGFAASFTVATSAFPAQFRPPDDAPVGSPTNTTASLAAVVRTGGTIDVYMSAATGAFVNCNGSWLV